MQLNLLTPIQRKSIENKNQKNRMIRSLVRREFQRIDKSKLIKNVIGDLKLLNKLLDPGIRPTLTGLLLQEVLKEMLNDFDDVTIDSYINNLKVLRTAGHMHVNVSQEPHVVIPAASISIRMEKSIKRKIYYILYIAHVGATLLGKKRSLTQKELKTQTDIPVASISRVLKELIEDGLVECDKTTKPFVFRLLTLK